MATEIIAIGTTAVDSSDVYVPPGNKLVVSLKDAAGARIAGGAFVDVKIKSDGSEYFLIGQLNASNPSIVLEGGTYRLSRLAGTSCGVFSESLVRTPNLVSRLPSAANTNNATLVKNAPGEVHHINGVNATAGVKYLKLFNKASAPSPSADTPFLTLALPASAPFAFNFPGGLSFSIGIGYALVTGAADLNNTAVAAADILGQNITYC